MPRYSKVAVHYLPCGMFQKVVCILYFTIGLRMSGAGLKVFEVQCLCQFFSTLH